MKRTLTIALLVVMAVMCLATASYATTSAELADKLYEKGQAYGMTSADKVKIERYLSEYPVTDEEAKNIEEIKTLMSDEKYEDGRQPLLVHLDVLVMFVKRYPNTASMCLSKIKRKQIKKVFEEWWIRNEKKIPSKYRIGIRENADNLFSELMNVETWEKSE